MATSPASTVLDIVLDHHQARAADDVHRAMSDVADDVVGHAPGEDLARLSFVPPSASLAGARR